MMQIHLKADGGEMGKIINIWLRKKEARTKFPVGSMVRVKMPSAWLDNKVGEVMGYDMFGADIDLELRVIAEKIMTTAPMRNCFRI
jgi:hypothetical protein